MSFAVEMIVPGTEGFFFFFFSRDRVVSPEGSRLFLWSLTWHGKAFMSVIWLKSCSTFGKCDCFSLFPRVSN